jgi:transcriptional adapter 2-alpha
LGGRRQADEELLLLEAIDMYGLGNWAAVAEHVGTKSTTECRRHYFDVYLNSKDFPSPQPAPEMANVRSNRFIQDPSLVMERPQLLQCRVA